MWTINLYTYIFIDHVAGILNSVEHSPMNILDYVNSTGNNQLNISELLMRFNSKTNELSAQPEPKVVSKDLIQVNYFEA